MSVYDEIFFTENIINVNKIVEKIIFSTGILPVCFYIFTALGLWHISTSYCLFIFCFSAVASVIVYFFEPQPENAGFINDCKPSFLYAVCLCFR